MNVRADFPGQRDLAELRHGVGLTLRALEDRSGIDKNLLNDYERGRRELARAEHLAALAREFGLTIDELRQRIAGPREPGKPKKTADKRLADLERRINEAVANATQEWAEDWGEEDEQVQLEAMLRRILRRATTSAPIDYESIYDETS